MLKETVSNSTIKKRRKNVTTNENDLETDIYKKVLHYEEKEAMQRNADSDASVYFATCTSIRSLLADIFKIKSEKTGDKSAISKKCPEACVKIAILKKLNRLEKYRTISTREALNAEKQKVDSTNLQYQNLLYEGAHLLSEFNKCKQFKSKDEDIELIPAEKFFEEAPEGITKAFVNSNNAKSSVTCKHELHLARLEYELTQRKKLSELCNTFEDEKKQLASDIIEKKKRLDGLGPRLSAVLEATKPLQEHLGLPIDKIQSEHKLATLLPDTLYLLYANTDAFKQVYNINMFVEILGDQEEAIQWKELQEIAAAAEIDSEQDNEQQEEVVEVKKRRHRKTSHVDPLEEKKKKLVDSHPLAVQITITLQNGPVLKIKFNYRPNMKIVTVTSQVDVPSKITGNAARDVLTGESILNELLKDDFGTSSPNPSNHYQLQKVGLGSFHSFVCKLGLPYLWAQRICGLDFLAEEHKNCVNKVSQANVEVIIKSIYRRLKHRYALSEQLQQLEQHIFPPLPKDLECPYNTISSMTKWSCSTWQAFCQNSSTTMLVENELVGPNDLYYCATITRQKATLHALIAIRNNYPQTVPIFSLTMKYNGEYHSGDSDEIRDMERAVNIGWEDTSKCANWLLTAQLRHLCAYFDVYLETLAPDNFPQNMVFFKKVSGRNRRRPFKFRKIGSGIFT